MAPASVGGVPVISPGTLRCQCWSGFLVVRKHESQYPVFRAPALSGASSWGAFRTLTAV